MGGGRSIAAGVDYWMWPWNGAVGAALPSLALFQLVLPPATPPCHPTLPPSPPPTPPPGEARHWNSNFDFSGLNPPWIDQGALFIGVDLVNRWWTCEEGVGEGGWLIQLNAPREPIRERPRPAAAAAAAATTTRENITILNLKLLLFCSGKEKKKMNFLIKGKMIGKKSRPDSTQKRKDNEGNDDGRWMTADPPRTSIITHKSPISTF